MLPKLAKLYNCTIDELLNNPGAELESARQTATPA
jgi:hypothetical protein